MKVDSKNFEDWLNKAENDLKAAEGILYYYEDPPTDTICYHCHQVAEKALKGFLIYSQGDIPKTHDLIELLNLSIHLNGTLAKLIEEVEILNKYYIEAKYPPDQPILYPKEEAKEVTEKAKLIMETIRSLIKK
jgi:HEPN domain-containing protein